MTYDAIIIGGGAGGATLAHALAPTGLRVLILERDLVGDRVENAHVPQPVRDVRGTGAETVDDRLQPCIGRGLRGGSRFGTGQSGEVLALFRCEA